MAEYPFIEKVKERVNAKDENIGWFLGEINKSNSWFYGIKSIFDLQLKTIMDISKILDFDFLQDYYAWSNDVLPTLSEPISRYDREPEMSIQITVRGPVKTVTTNLTKFLEVIVKEGSKAGLNVS